MAKNLISRLDRIGKRLRQLKITRRQPAITKVNIYYPTDDEGPPVLAESYDVVNGKWTNYINHIKENQDAT